MSRRNLSVNLVTCFSHSVKWIRRRIQRNALTLLSHSEIVSTGNLAWGSWDRDREQLLSERILLLLLPPHTLLRDNKVEIYVRQVTRGTWYASCWSRVDVESVAPWQVGQTDNVCCMVHNNSGALFPPSPLLHVPQKLETWSLSKWLGLKFQLFMFVSS